MAIRPILLHPDPRLKKRADEIGAPTDAHRALAEDMLATMYDAPGIGLAAPQVGVLERMIVMDCEKGEDAAPRPMVLIDPEVTWASDERAAYEEGCLSIPEQFADVERPAAVTVAWTDLDGARREETFDGLWATCVQHEIDHLDGILFIDHVGPMKRQLITRKALKMKKERAREAAT
ncbi:MAG: peptide deformylase [Hasllibacter sp.]